MTRREPAKSPSETSLPSWSGSVKSGAFTPASIIAGSVLAAEAELGDQGAVALEVGALEVTEQAAALADQHQQAAARVVVLAVLTQVLGELVDALGEQRDLDLGGSGVGAVAAELGDDLGL